MPVKGGQYMLEDLVFGVLENMRAKGVDPDSNQLCQKMLR